MCALLTLWRAALRLVRGGEGRGPERPRKILFIKMTEQGATVIGYPAIQAAVQRVGRDNVYFWVFEENRPILELMDVIPQQNIISLRAKKPLQFLWDFTRTLLRIRMLRIDAVIDLEFLSRASAIFGYLTGAARRVGFHRFANEGCYRGDLLTHRLAYNIYLHTSVTFRLLVEALDLDPGEVPLPKVPVAGESRGTVPQYVPQAADVEAMQRLVGELPGTGPVVLLNPNASDLLPLRKWPTERFLELARRVLAHESEPRIVFTGAPNEAAQAGVMVRELGSDRVVSAAGRTSLRELFALYTLADVLVTNDSGPAHFSAMTEVSAIILFGPETPALYGPMSDRAQVVWKGLACSPCVNIYNHRFSPCNNNVCMQMITVDEVYGRVCEALAERQPKRKPNGRAKKG
jgi:ADP-heptose:LPS heptosyltransferase